MDSFRRFSALFLTSILLAMCLSIGLAALVPSAAHAAVFVVTSAADPSEAGLVTLRDAITSANAAGPGPHNIDFNIAGGGPHVINLASPLPTISQRVIINGYSEGGTPPSQFAPADIRIALNGAGAGAGVPGLMFGAPGANYSEVRGLRIYGFGGYGIWINAADHIEIGGNVIGLNTADAAAPNSLGGIRVVTGYNVIGNSSPAFGDRNVISGNTGNGIYVTGGSAQGNMISGNYIGTNPIGNLARPNTQSGVVVQDATFTSIGGSTDWQRNVISNNGLYGALMVNGASSMISGNYIGLDVNGLLDMGNGNHGVQLVNCTTGQNVVGGSMAGQGNVISGNLGGVTLEDSSGQAVAGNYIGTDRNGMDGSGTLGNATHGVQLIGSANNGNIIGGTGGSSGNLISGNDFNGVYLFGGATNNAISGNTIGLDSTGAALGNSQDGVCIEADLLNPPPPTGNTIGGDSAPERNIIASNGGSGVSVYGPGTSANTVAANYIGTRPDGAGERGNYGHGVYIVGGPSGNFVGGVTAAEGNVISGNGTDPVNGGNGVTIDDADGNTVRGNYVGTDLTGMWPVANTRWGVVIMNGSTGNTVGGTNPSDRNVISGQTLGSSLGGVNIDDSDGNFVRGNHIGPAADGTVLGNNSDGVRISNGSTGNEVGGPAPGSQNLISNNNGNGVFVTGSNTNVVCGNLIGTDPTGDNDLGNGDAGVRIEFAPDNTIGGTGGLTRNVISGNQGDGVAITNGSTGNFVRNNLIGTNSSGSAAIANGQAGIFIRGSNGNTIGGSGETERNLISGNTTSGILVWTGDNNVISGNWIGLDSDGAGPIPNADGVNLFGGSAGNVVGGATEGERNVISGNSDDGVLMNILANGNFVRGNFIGLAANGAAPAPNEGDGVEISSSSSDNTIGGAAPGQGNVISGNDTTGVNIDDATDNLVQGNTIGTFPDGLDPMPNMFGGVFLQSGADDNTIGGPLAGMGNLISGNLAYGVAADNSHRAYIAGNMIGTNEPGTAACGNFGYGVALLSADSTVVGGPTVEERNVISGNFMEGIHLDTGTNTLISGNYIGVGADGVTALANDSGVVALTDSDFTTIGGSAADGNVISGNTNDGVYFEDSDSFSLSYNDINSNGQNGVGIGGASLQAGIVENNIHNNGQFGVVLLDPASYTDLISSNSIFGNGSLGISISGTGTPTPNDGNNNNPAKPNRGYNYPEFSSGSVPLTAPKRGRGASTTGTLNLAGTAPPNSLIEIYYTGSPADPSGHGEGYELKANTEAGPTGDFTATISGVSPGMSFSAIATSPPGDPSGVNNTSEFSANVQAVAPELSVIKQAGVDKAAPGATITYTITITNNGGAPATNAGFTDEVPANTTVVPGSATISDPAAVKVSENPVRFTGITVAAGGTVTVTFKVTVNEDVQAGTVIKNQSFVSYGTVVVPSSDPAHPGQGTTTDFVVQETKTLGAKQWFIAEGSTGGGFDTWVLVQNPGAVEAKVAVTFSTAGGPKQPVDVKLAAKSRTSIRVADYVPNEWGVSTIISSDQPVVAERSTYWNRNYCGETDVPGTPKPYEMRSGHANLGVPQAATLAAGLSNGGRTSYFPEGATAGGFDTWILLVNPNAQVANAKVQLMTESGLAKEENVTVGALSRGTVHLDEYLPNANQVATAVISDVPLVAERSMYWDPNEVNMDPCCMRGGHSNAGSPAPNTSWFLAEGSTGGGFETFVLLQNPNNSEAKVTLDFSDASGVAGQATATMPANSRATVKVSDYVKDDFQVSTKITADKPVVAERSMYWDKRRAARTCDMRDGHSTVGTNRTAATWMVPEGSTGGGFETFVLIANTGNAGAAATLTFMTQAGPIAPVNVTVPANSRYTVRISDYVPNQMQVSTLVESASSDLVVERSMYWDKREASPGGEPQIRPYEMMGGHSANGVDP